MRITVVACLALLATCTPTVIVRPAASPNLPPDWSVHDAGGLRIAAPATWSGPEVLPATDTTGAPRAYIVYRDAAGTEVLTLLTWRDTTAEKVAATQFQSELPQGRSPATASLIEGNHVVTVYSVTGYAQWSGPSGAGTYECRHLFVQVDPRIVADVIACGPRITGSQTPTPELRRAQEQVALRLRIAGGQP